MTTLRRAATAAALALSALVTASGGTAPVEASIQTPPDATVESFDPFDEQVGIADTAAAHNPNRDEYLVAAHVASGTRWIEVTIVKGDGTAVVAPFTIHTDSEGSTVGAPINTTLDVEYNPIADEYLVSFVRTAPRGAINSPRVHAQRVSATGSPIGTPTPISRVNSSDFRCTTNQHDVEVDPVTGDYILAYNIAIFQATDDPCEDLSGRQKTTVARVTSTLSVGPRTDLPGTFEKSADFTSIDRHPITGDYLVGRTHNAGSTFTLIDATFAVKAEQSVVFEPGGPSGFSTYVGVAADPATGKWMAVARGSLASQTMILNADGSVDVAAAIRFPNELNRVEALGDGLFVGVGSGRLFQLDLRGEVLSSAMMPGPDGSNPTPGDVASAGDGRFLATGRNLVGFVPALAAELVAVPAATLPLPPARLADTRDIAGAMTVDGEFQRIGAIQGGQELELEVAGRAGVPEDASAAMLNIAAAGAASGGFVTAYPCGSQQPNTSNLNFAAGAAASAGAYVALSDEGTTCLFASTTIDLIVDVNGYVPSMASISSIVPERLLETRSGQAEGTVDGQQEGAGRVGPGVVELPVAGRGSVPADASAVMVNITAVRPSQGIFVTAFPCGQDQPTAANLNAAAGSATNNLALARIGEDGKVCLFTSGETDLVVDVSAFVPAVGSLVSINPERFIETRPGEVTVDGANQFGQRFTAGESRNFLSVAGRGSVPGEAKGVMLNVAAIRPSSNGFVTVYPCGDQPNTASVNYAANSVTSNAVFVALSDPDGWICIFTSAETDLAVDVVGYTNDS